MRRLLAIILACWPFNVLAQTMPPVTQVTTTTELMQALALQAPLICLPPGNYATKTKGALIALAAICLATGPTPASAWTPPHSVPNGGGPPPPPGCPYPVDGGCAAAPANGSFQYASFYTHVTNNTAPNVGSNQTWTSPHPWGWNQACVDYKCSYYTALGSLIDPAVSPPIGWTYNATGSTGGGPQLRFNGSASQTVTGYDFGPVGGHGCTQIYITGTPPTITFNNDHFKGDGVCENTNGYMVRNDTTAVNAMTVVTSSEIDGNNRGDSTGNPSGDFKMDASGTACTRGIQLRYVYWHDSINRPMNSCAFGVVDIKYSVFDAYAVAENRTGIHGEIWQGAQGAGTGGTAQAVDFDFNLVLMPNTNPSPGVFGVYLHTGQSNLITLSYAEVENNIFIAECNINGTGTCGTGSIANTTGSSIMLTLGFKNITALNVIGNYGDPIGALNCMTNPSSASTIGALTISGNVSLETGGPISGFGGAGSGASCPPLFTH